MQKIEDEDMDEIVQISTAVDSRQSADTLAASLVEKRLAACVQITGPMASVYRWKGGIEHGTEWLLTAKTVSVLFGAVEQEIKRMHPYELPEITSIHVTGGSDEYLGWVRDEVKYP